MLIGHRLGPDPGPRFQYQNVPAHGPAMTLERVVNAMRIGQLLEPWEPRNMVDALRRHAVADFLYSYDKSHRPRTGPPGCWSLDRLPWAEC